MKLRASQSSVAQFGQTQIGAYQITAFQIDPGHPGPGEVGMPNHGVRQPSARKVGTAQVDPGRDTAAALHPATPGGGQATTMRSLDVRRPVVQPRQLPIDRRRRVLRPIWGADQPGSMGADECAKDFGDGPPVGGRVPGDALQGEDAAEAHVRRLAAELVDRTGEPLGDLSFAVDLDLPPCRDGPGDQQQPSDALQQRSPSVVLQFGLGLLQLDSPIACHALQLGWGQRRMQQTGKDQDAGQQECQQHPRSRANPSQPTGPRIARFSLLTKADRPDRGQWVRQYGSLRFSHLGRKGGRQARRRIVAPPTSGRLHSTHAGGSR